MFGMKSRGQSGPERDLGFGSALASESGARLLNQDKSFNTQRVGLGPLASLHLYDALLTISWPRFLALVAIAYLVSNVAFAFAYMALGPEALTGALHRGLRKHRARFGRREHSDDDRVCVRNLRGGVNDRSRLRPLRAAHGKDPVQQERSHSTLSRRARLDVSYREPAKHSNHRARNYRHLQSHGGRRRAPHPPLLPARARAAESRFFSTRLDHRPSHQ